MAKQTFSVDEIEAFQKVKKRQLQLQRWAKSIDEEMDKLKRQKRHQTDELADIEKKLKSKEFKHLEANKELFIVTDVPDTALDEIGTKYISTEKKELLLARCIDDYRGSHAGSTELPFRWLKEHLATKYGIKCRSVSQFFKTVWADSEFGGGNKNKYLVIDK